MAVVVSVKAAGVAQVAKELDGDQRRSLVMQLDAIGAVIACMLDGTHGAQALVLDELLGAVTDLAEKVEN